MKMNTSQDANLTAADSVNITMTTDQPSDVFDVIVYCMCFSGLFLNAFSITATANIPHSQTPHFKLIISLGASDSLIILGIVYHHVITLFTKSNPCIKLVETFLINTSLLATLTNLLAISVDHYFAITKPLSYRRFISRYRGNCLVLAIWIFSCICGLLDIFIGMTIQFEREQFCATILSDDFKVEHVILAFTLVVLVGIVAVYSKIYSVVKKLMSRDQKLNQDETHGHKAVVTTSLVIGTFAVCWLPSCLFQIVMNIKIQLDAESVKNNLEVLYTVHKILIVLLLTNSLCDPIIYAVRLSEVQKGYRQILYKIFPGRRFNLNEEGFRHRQPPPTTL